MLLVVDMANVLGSRPDGWWRDRAGATAALIAAIRDRDWSAEHWAAIVAAPSPVDEVLLVVEGAARRAADGSPPGTADRGRPEIRVLLAAGSGDDAIDAVVAGAPAGSAVVVTSDRGLRERVRARGAQACSAGRFRAALDGG